MVVTVTTDTFLLVLFTNLFTLALSSAFYASRIHELRVEHVREKAEINSDYLMQRKVYGQLSMEDILGRESFDG